MIAVIGGLFGDCGKGKVVSSLALSYKTPLIIRFSGGQQAGHRVVLKDGRSHIFSNFGSATLNNCPTYWSKYCTFDPIATLKELIELKELCEPVLFVDGECPVTTPYDQFANIENEKRNNHGTCGYGVGQTHQREEDHYHLKVRDLQYPFVFKEKLKLIESYYKKFHLNNDEYIRNCSQLFEFTDNILILNDCSNKHNKLSNYDEWIFEGSQGLLLDQNYGFFPHVTRSNTGIKNIYETWPVYRPEIYIVIRAYLTRHGNGPLPNEEYSHLIPDNPHEHNKFGIQGRFKKTILDLNLLKYAIGSDPYIGKKTLVITCLDVMKKFAFTIKDKIYYCDDEDDFIENILNYLFIEDCLTSHSPYTGELE